MAVTVCSFKHRVATNFPVAVFLGIQIQASTTSATLLWLDEERSAVDACLKKDGCWEIGSNPGLKQKQHHRLCLRWLSKTFF